jgi:hypothetical protein
VKDLKKDSSSQVPQNDIELKGRLRARGFGDRRKEVRNMSPELRLNGKILGQAESGNQGEFITSLGRIPYQMEYNSRTNMYEAILNIIHAESLIRSVYWPQRRIQLNWQGIGSQTLDASNILQYIHDHPLRTKPARREGKGGKKYSTDW